ncbi:Uncharacterised protein [Nocardia otitidiscaviarum]|uniref:ChaN family lipoprotein n=1 Tax=Nocardia otitidiscaviarum TaxID=1823 RepID=A0A378YSA8_9NOCA|nr:DUF5682 family protein [Nocardia otitidiscaviarum]SUA80036.1 Uncharacterised protein [Nocardia otitidiscaviarum]
MTGDAARVTFIGVRHHSPACARLVRDTVRALRPAYVLIEGPVDMNDRLDELLLGHQLPIAVFSSYRDRTTRHMSWAPLCDYSPEWVALTEGRAAGSVVRFIDLPAWHSAFADTENRYADAERRYDHAVTRLCREFAVDNIDTLWDHLVEIGDDATLAERLAAYFDLVRGDDEAGAGDVQREEYMARWIHAAVDAANRAAGTRPAPIVVVTGGFHRPALVRRLDEHLLSARTAPSDSPWPHVPPFPGDGVGGSYLVPYSFRRLDAFDGYQSGMPSPEYYQRLWEDGPEQAAEGITRAVVRRLRERGQPVSTAALIGARTLTGGLSRLRGHRSPSRTDVLDGLAGALVTEALDRPLPWTGRGQLRPGTDPVVVEMVAALSGSRTGRLHRDTPHPPLVHDADSELARHGIPERGEHELDLATDSGLAASRVLHRLRVLDIPGYRRTSGPLVGRPPDPREVWRVTASPLRLPMLIEAGSLGATCAEAAATRLGERFDAAGSDTGGLAEVLFDATLCGLAELGDTVVDRIRGLIESAGDTAGLGQLLAVTLSLWRHDRIFGTAHSPTLAALIDAAVLRLLWLIEAIRGGPAPADDRMLHALIAIRDTTQHAPTVLSVDRADIVGVFRRGAAPDRPPALRGAAVGLVAALAPDETLDLARAVRLAGQPEVLGDFLAGLFALAREQLLDTDAPLLAVLDELVDRFAPPDFLTALPALRLAFAWFPPRERARIATRLLAARGADAAPATLLRLDADAGLLARARALEARVDELLTEHALLANPLGSGHD